MRKKWFGLMASAVLAVSVLGGCGSGSEGSATDDGAAGLSGNSEAESGGSDETYKVSFADASSGNGISLFRAIAEANNLSDGLDLDIEWVEGLSSGPEIIAAVTGGSLNIGTFGDFPVVTSYGSDQKPAFTVVGYAENVESTCLFVKADSDIQTLEDMKGHTIGLQLGSGSQYQTQLSLSKVGLTVDDVELVNLDTGSWLSAFVNNQVDVVCIQKVVTIANEGMGDIRILDQEDYGLTSLIADTEWAKENPETVARVLILLHRVLEFVEENEETAIQDARAAYPEVSEERIRWTLESLTDTYLTPVGERAIERYTQLKDFSLQVGTIEKDFDVSDVYDNSYIELANELIKELE